MANEMIQKMTDSELNDMLGLAGVLLEGKNLNELTDVNAIVDSISEDQITKAINK